MAHMLATTASGKAAMAYVGDTPWHGLGQLLTAEASLDVWAEESGLDFMIEAADVKFSTPDTGWSKSQTLPYAGKKVLYRTDSNLPLGLVSDRYKVVQPMEVLEFYRDMVGNIAHLETAGVLRNGAHYWALAKMDGEFNIAGDKVEQYLLLASSCDGSLATQARLTSVRVVCNNTLQLAASDRSGSVVQVRHNSVFDASQVRCKLGEFNDAFKTFEHTAKYLASIKLSSAQAQSVFTKILGGDNKKPSRAAARALALFEGSGIGAELESSKGTAWGALNAVTQLLDWETARTPDARMANAWFGGGVNVKSKVAEELLALG
jgi:phage/plasmid-like protein (TIGR03299 family)